MSSVVAPFDQSNEYEPEGITVILILPFGLVHEVIEVEEPSIVILELPVATVTLPVDEQPPGAVTVTV